MACFLFLFVLFFLFDFATKEKEKDISKNFFISKQFSYFFFFIAIKEEKRTVFYALTSVAQMDIAGVPALLRSLKNARGASVVHF